MEEKGPKVEARPPALIDWLVRALIPPAAREAVVGDLWERYRSPLQYVADAAKVIPHVVASQVRRSTSFPLAATQAIILFGCLGGFIRADDPRAGVIPAPTLEGAAVAAVAGLVALLLRDAYRAAERWTIQRGFIDIVAVAACVALSQAVLAVLVTTADLDPDWLLPRLRALLFAITALPGLLVLRLVLGLDGDLRLSGTEGQSSAEDIVRDYREFQARVRARNGVFLGTLLMLVAAAGFLWLFVKPPLVGYWFLAGHLCVIAYVAAKGAARAMPSGIGFAETRAHYQRELDRQRRLFRLMLWWWLLPLFLGIAMQAVAPGIRSGETPRIVFGTAATLLLGVGIVMLNRNRTRRFRAKIATLAALTER